MSPKRSSSAARHIRWVSPLPEDGSAEAERWAAEPEPHFDDWREAWEWSAERALRAFLTWTEDQLLTATHGRRYDRYYQIWEAIRQRGSLARSAPCLIEVLRREVRGTDAMLIRYHCAAALFSLLGYPDQPMPKLRERVQWDREGEPARLAAIKELEQLVRQRLEEAAAAATESSR